MQVYTVYGYTLCFMYSFVWNKTKNHKKIWNMSVNQWRFVWKN